MDRITKAHLQFMVDQINDLTDSPKEPYSQDDAGQLRANIGNYHLSWAYGGVSLHRMCSPGGGITTPLHCGHIPKRDLYDLMHAFIRGIDAARNL
jgi:hypothetical protein